VRDKAARDKVPKLYSHALCLTIFEAKGLEFEDVILYNFFSDSKVPSNKWSLLSQLTIEEEWLSTEDFLRTCTVHE
jgi:hypothetical protein